MGKAEDWGKIFENLLLFSDFAGRLSFFEDGDIAVKRLFFEKALIEEDVLLNNARREELIEERLKKNNKRLGENKSEIWDEIYLYELSGTEEGQREFTAFLPYEAFLKDEFLKKHIVNEGFDENTMFNAEKSLAEYEEGELLKKDELLRIRNRDGDEIISVYTENAENEITSLAGGKKRQLLDFYEEREKSEVREIRVEVVKEEKSEVQYDADIISEMVGNKLYEIMQKSTEGYYM